MTAIIDEVLQHREERLAEQTALIGAGEFVRVKKDDQGIVRDLSILQSKFIELLRGMGFRRYDIGEAFVIVRIQNNIIEECPLHRVREIIMRHLYGLDKDVLGDIPRDMLIEKFYRSMTTLTNLDKLAMLVTLDQDDTALDIAKDQLDRALYFYRNGFVEVNREGYRLRPYDELPGLIWKDQILQRDFVKLTAAEVENGDYWKFANNIADNYIDKESGKRHNPERFISFCTITGYNLHRFFETKLRCTVFLDSRVTNDDEPDGRSGKSLHCKALSLILNSDARNGKACVIIDGKRYDENNRFNLDELHMNTVLAIFDDLKRSFSIENFFNSIPDGMVRERKGDLNKVRIMAKIIFTLNYTLKVHGGSAKDRVIEFEVADYYSEKFSPETEFGRWMFRDWDAEEWARFDNFMMQCVYEYFRLGVLLPSTINLDVRKLRNDTAPEFINFMQDLTIQHLQTYKKKDLYNLFLEEIKVGADNQRRDELKFMSQRIFTKFLRLWAQYRPELAGYCEYRSNGNDYIRFFENMPVPNAEMLEGAVLFPHKSKHVAVEAKPEPPAKQGDNLPF